MTYRFLIFVLVLNAFSSCESLTSNESHTSYIPDAEGVYGIDVSHHQGDIEWGKVGYWNNRKIEFVYIKATEGASYLDKKYKSNFKSAIENKLRVGSYHYFRTTSSPEDQFANFIKHVDLTQQGLIPMIDLEENENWTTEAYNENLSKFLKLVEDTLKRKPLMYSVQGFYNTHLKDRYLKYHWNIARYSRKKPRLLDANRWSIWQFSDKEKIRGISETVDVNLLSNRVTLSELSF